MTTRRFFIKQMLFFAGLLISCGTKTLSKAGVRASGGRTGETDGAPARGAIFVEIVNDAEIKVACRFKKDMADAWGSHPLQAAFLCAVEAHNQVPRCVPLFKGDAARAVAGEEDKGYYRYRFRTRVDQALKLPGQGTYFVHLACRQFRSQVWVVRIKA